jgi:hypothetical protein
MLASCFGVGPESPVVPPPVDDEHAAAPSARSPQQQRDREAKERNAWRFVARFICMTS